MTFQQELFDEHAHARRSDPPTSKAAAASIEVARMEAQVLEVLRQYPAGLTTEQIAGYTGEPLVSISPRLRPLAEKGLVEDSDERRLNVSGRRAIIWKVK